MDLVAVFTIIAVVAINAIDRMISYGRLKQEVKHHSSILNDGLCDEVQKIRESQARSEGVVGKVDGMSRNLANLEGTVRTFMEMTKEQRKG